jgi:heme exporter protein B
MLHDRTERSSRDGAREPPRVRSSVLADAMIVCGKDLRIEARTREVVTTAGFFAALVAILASVAFYSGDGPKVAPGALWLSVAFASVLAIARSWQREREESALVGLLVSPIARSAIFLGKALGIFAFLIAVEAVVLPIVALLFHVDLVDALPATASILVLGTLGVAATGTLFGAMTVRTRARDLVLATVLFPLLSPTLLAGVSATKEIFATLASGRAPIFAELRDYYLLLGVFDAVAILGGIALFGALIEE